MAHGVSDRPVPGLRPLDDPGSVPLYQSYTLTERFELPGTSEEVQLFLLPLRVGGTAQCTGCVGFEISESYFKQNFAQPTGFDRLSCLLAPAGDGLAADAALSSGTTAATTMPRNTLVLRSLGGRLTQLTGPTAPMRASLQLYRLSENQSYRLAVCIPWQTTGDWSFPAICRCCSSACSSPFSWCSAA
ncbi:MAG: hypothetical protein ACLVJH_06870 [Faecalibacterium prausnitzii]